MEQQTIQIVPESELQTAISDTDQIIEITDVGIIGLDSLCRLCSNRSDHLISIYEGEGLEHQLQLKMNRYLPFQVEQVDSMPNHCCYQCASTLLNWHELVETSIEADRRLKALQQDLQRISIYEESDTQAVVEDPNETCITLTTSSDQRVAQSRAPGFLSFRQAQTNFNVEYLTQCLKPSSDEIQSIKLKIDKINEFGTFDSSVTVNHEYVKPEIEKHIIINSFCGISESNIEIVENTEINTNEIQSGESSESNSKLKVQNRTKTSNSKQCCSVCKNVFKRVIDLKRHLKTHTDLIKSMKKDETSPAETIMCKICNKQFKKSIELQMHVATHNINQSVQNEFNQLEDSDSNSMKYVENDNSNSTTYSKKRDEDSSQKIDTNDKEVQNVRTSLKTNKLICRNSLNKDEIEQARITIDKRTYYRCKECGKNLHSPYTYKWHCRIHTGERPYVCDLCGKQFRVSQGLVRHLRETHAGIKNFPCDLCGRMFATRRNVEEHRRIHTNERPYVCDLCGKAFKQKASLFVHNRSHTDSFPHKCSYCGQGFRTKPPLLVHVTRHTGEKPFPCEICGRCFRIKYELKRHRLIHSDEKPFSCTECGTSFRQKRYLRNHNKMNHNSRISI